MMDSVADFFKTTGHYLNLTKEFSEDAAQLLSTVQKDIKDPPLALAVQRPLLHYGPWQLPMLQILRELSDETLGRFHIRPDHAAIGGAVVGGIAGTFVTLKYCASWGYFPWTLMLLADVLIPVALARLGIGVAHSQPLRDEEIAQVYLTTKTGIENKIKQADISGEIPLHRLSLLRYMQQSIAALSHFYNLPAGYTNALRDANREVFQDETRLLTQKVDAMVAQASGSEKKVIPKDVETAVHDLSQVLRPQVTHKTFSEKLEGWWTSFS